MELTFAEIVVEVSRIGKDLSVAVSGGERPHIGCIILAVPRPSLRDDGKISCTSSVLNVTGHKDEVVCREIAETLCRKYHCTVAAAGGFHVDNMTVEQIREVQEQVSKFCHQIKKTAG